MPQQEDYFKVITHVSMSFEITDNWVKRLTKRMLENLII